MSDVSTYILLAFPWAHSSLKRCPPSLWARTGSLSVSVHLSGNKRDALNEEEAEKMFETEVEKQFCKG